MFGGTMRLYRGPSCTPGYGSPGSTPRTMTCTYPDGTVLTQVVAGLGPAGSQFTISATRALQLQFARILTNGTTSRIGSAPSSNVNNLLFGPTLMALDQAGCGGAPGSAISMTGVRTLAVVGDVVSNGTISITGGGNVQVAADIYDRSEPPVPGGVPNPCYPHPPAPPCPYPSLPGT